MSIALFSWERHDFHRKTIGTQETQGTLEGSRVFLGIGFHCRSAPVQTRPRHRSDVHSLCIFRFRACIFSRDDPKCSSMVLAEKLHTSERCQGMSGERGWTRAAALARRVRELRISLDVHRRLADAVGRQILLLLLPPPLAQSPGRGRPGTSANFRGHPSASEDVREAPRASRARGHRSDVRIFSRRGPSRSISDHLAKKYTHEI